jgi:hypothetical protein
MTRYGILAGGAAVACLGLSLMAGPALAGPCSEDIAELERVMNDPTGKASGTLSGSAPGAIQNEAPMPVETPTGPTGKEQGTLAGNAPGDPNKVVDPTGGIATSAQDVRLQQAGQPTTAQGGDPGALDAQRGEAMAALDKARDLDAKNDSGCTAAVEEARQQFRKGT